VSSDELSRAVERDLPPILTDEELREHPLAIWIELEIGLKEGQRLARRAPITIHDAATKLAEASVGENRIVAVSKSKACSQ
jgi:hypothetical protein